MRASKAKPFAVSDAKPGRISVISVPLDVENLREAIFRHQSIVVREPRARGIAATRISRASGDRHRRSWRFADCILLALYTGTVTSGAACQRLTTRAEKQNQRWGALPGSELWIFSRFGSALRRLNDVGGAGRFSIVPPGKVSYDGCRHACRSCVDRPNDFSGRHRYTLFVPMRIVTPVLDASRKRRQPKIQSTLAPSTVRQKGRDRSSARSSPRSRSRTRCARLGSGTPGRGRLPATGGQRGHLLRVEEEVRAPGRHASCRRLRAARGREHVG